MMAQSLAPRNEDQRVALPHMFRAMVMLGSKMYQIGEDQPDFDSAFELCTFYGKGNVIQIYDDEGCSLLEDGMRKWTKKEILEMWPKAAEELKVLQRQLQVSIVANACDFLSMAIQLAHQTFDQLQLPICEECGISMCRDGDAFICGRCGGVLRTK